MVKQGSILHILVNKIYACLNWIVSVDDDLVFRYDETCECEDHPGGVNVWLGPGF